MQVQFCGAAQEVTGSAHLITLDNGYKVLLDCGLYQGRNKQMKEFNRNWFFSPADIDAVVLSHAHIDHSGRLPKLVKDGFTGSIFCTRATKSLATLMLLDSAKIQERDASYHNSKILKKKPRRSKNKKLRKPLYTTDDAILTIAQFVGINYENWVKINENVAVLFRDAGHILGSASVALRITENGKTALFGFTGDIGRPDRPILKDPKQMHQVDYLICESTYGNRDHETKPAEASRFLEIIKKTCVEKKGKLLIPAFSIGRTQEIVYMLDQMESAGQLPKIPIYVDSPLAVNATQVFASHPECYDKQLAEYMILDPNPFGFNELHYIREVALSKQLNETQDACIIISASGMMNAGRVRHHLANSMENKKNTILIVGYCSPDTPGGMLRDGVQSLKLFGEWRMLNADIEIMDSFSAHGDRTEMADFISNQKKLKKLFLVHGQLDSQTAFRTFLFDRGFKTVEIPELGDTVQL